MPVAAAGLKAIVAVASEAVADVDDAALREIAYRVVLERLLDRSPTIAHACSELAAQDEGEWGVWPLRTEQARADEVAAYFNITPEQAVDIFDLSSVEPAVRLPWSQIPADHDAAARKLALLAVGIRASLGLDATTAQVACSLRAHRIPHASTARDVVREMAEFKIISRPGRSGPIVRLNKFGVERVRAAVADLIAS